MGNGTAEGTPGPREGVAEGPAPWTPGCSWGPIRGTTGGRRRAVGGVVLGCAGHSRGPGRLSKGARGTGFTPDCPPRSEHPSDPSSSCSLSPPAPGHVTLTWPPSASSPRHSRAQLQPPGCLPVSSYACFLPQEMHTRPSGAASSWKPARMPQLSWEAPLCLEVFSPPSVPSSCALPSLGRGRHPYPSTQTRRLERCTPQW